jgi:predicted DNA-binding transcriptional regulator AlpA
MVQIVQLDYEDLQTAIKSCLKEAIDEIKSLPAPSNLPDKCGVKDICQEHGFSEAFVYRETSRGSMPCSRFGNRLVFSRKEVHAWVQNRTIRKQSHEQKATAQLKIAAIQKAKRKG